MKIIGGNGNFIGEVTIKIHFKELGMIIDMEFSILDDNASSLLPNMDMIENSLDIIQRRKYLHVGILRDLLPLEENSLVNRWLVGNDSHAI